ncbi:MAG: hydantoinase/oxoprolinase family protein [Beijerinckiaceae bacterium]|nr:hydantoinase/oxoprolinase family protein [Beijerinckiaceae bacterium]
MSAGSHDGKPVRIGVDIGGTFTDFQILDSRSGQIRAFKVPTTPEDPSLGLMEGIHGAAARDGFRLDEVGYILHGTTIATNAVLENKLARGALVTTAGFEDVLEIGRHNRRDIYATWPRPVPALVPRSRRLGLRERMKADGHAEIEPGEADLEAIITRLAGLEVEAVAISLLHAYANPAHEARLAARIAQSLPGLAISCSSTVSPEIREYERTSTTVLNALLQPVVRSYLERLERRLAAEAFEPRLLIVQSNGGVCAPATAAAEPVRLLLSGPSGGAMAALGLSRTLGEANVVAVDMGGTSYDVSVVREDRLEIVTQSEIERLPVRVPMIDIRTIGAGGGSIARLGPDGGLRVGPESAGARPGPVCYGRGGTEPTVTDANLVLGRLDPAFFLGGKMALDLEGARAAIRSRVGTPLGLAEDAAAAGILRLTNTSLAAAIRVSLFEKGLDPRDFTLLSFGGAGSVHACAVAEELAIRRIVFPVDASTLSARGILEADIEHAFARSLIRRFEPAAGETLARLAAEMTAQAGAQLAADGIPPERRRTQLAIDLRYRGQAFELTVPCLDSGFDPAGIAAIAGRFHAQHEQRFSYCNPGDAVEMVTLRRAAKGLLPRPAAVESPAEAAGSPLGSRPVYLADRWGEAAVWRRESIGPGLEIAGPAMIEEAYTTIYLAPAWRLRRAAGGHLVADYQGEGG